MKLRTLFVLAALAAPLAACNAARAPDPQALAPQGAPAERAAVKLPEGSGCAGSIGRYRAVMDNDRSMGHVNQGVYDQIQGEIGEAERACAAGEDGHALSLVRSSKARHGYPG